MLIVFADVIIRAASKISSMEELGRLIADILADDPVFHPDGSVTMRRGVVMRSGPVKIVVRPNEHPPPHFHAVGPDFDASFSISDVSLIHGKIGATERKVIELCYRGARDRIIRAWNESRPSDCQVGTFREG